MPPVDPPVRPGRRNPLLGRLARRAQPGLPQQQPQPIGSAPAPEPRVNPYDFSADPILQRIQALGERRTAEAEARALSRRKQLAIEFGDPALAVDEESRAAALANPFSRTKLFEKASREEPKALTENLNQGNLFYSTEFGKQQSNLAQNLLQRQQQMQAEARANLSGIEDDRRAALEGIENDITSGREAAAQRLQDRLGDLDFPTGIGTQRPMPIGGAVRQGLAQRLRAHPPPQVRPPRRGAYRPGNRP